MIAASSLRPSNTITLQRSVVRISAVVPVFRGELFLAELVDAFEQLRKTWEEQSAPLGLAEVIFVDDASVDGSSQVLRELQERHSWIRVLNLSRNFGQHPATVAGILHTCGDWVCTLDEDLQHPPEFLPMLLAEAVEHSFDVVYAQPVGSVHESPFRDGSSRIFKALLGRLAGNRHVSSFNSFRFIRGSVARAAAAVSSADTYFDIALCWFTDRIGSCRLNLKDKRFIEQRQSGYSFFGLLRHARRMLVSSQLKVLRLGAACGFVALVSSVVAGLTTLLCKLLFPDLIQVQGWTSLTLIVLFFGGLISVLVGIALEYLLIILMKTQGQPTFLVLDRGNDEVLKNWFIRRIPT